MKIIRSPAIAGVHGSCRQRAGASKAAQPMVVLPHGGPWARDDQSFDWWAFFYAARGYLVYQPNFRGSDGNDEAFRRAGCGEWGRKMQRSWPGTANRMSSSN